jgi:hypothetical protein
MLGRAARPGLPHDGALDDDLAPGDGDRAEVGQRHGEAVGREDGDHTPVGRHGPREADRSSRRGEHGLTRGAADVDTPVLSTGVDVRAERERTEHVPLERP